MFERFFHTKESQPKAPSLDELETRNKEFELRLKTLIEKRDEVQRKIKALTREQDGFERGRKPPGSSRTLLDVLGDKGSLWRELDKVQMEINQVLEEIQRDDEAFKKLTGNEHSS